MGSRTTWPTCRCPCFPGIGLAAVLPSGMVAGLAFWLKGVTRFATVGVGRFSQIRFVPKADCKIEFLSRKIPGSIGCESVSGSVLVFD